jgi:hypothetical protein
LLLQCRPEEKGLGYLRGFLAYPTITDGVDGVRFVEASIKSNETDSWVPCKVNAAN